MSHENALAGEMRRLLASLGSTPPPLDQVTADQLLAGRLNPADAPPGYAAVARLLAAAAAPPGQEELAGEHRAVAEFAAVTRSTSPTLTSRRAGMPSKRFSVKAIAVAVAAVMTVGGIAAAATDRLPGSARRVADEVPATTHASVPATQGGTATRPGAAGSTAGSPTGGQKAGTGPDAAGAARDGLCRAWLAGKGGDNGERDDSTAFQALARAAGGAANIAAWCKASTASQADRGRRPDEPPGPRTSPPSSGATPPGGGNGQGGGGQGGPPTTG
jgi:hypothetical protein